jgi:hypothetical protein
LEISNNLEKVTVFFDRFFFIFAISELECDRCSFELCFLFLLNCNNRIVSFARLALVYSYPDESVRTGCRNTVIISGGGILVVPARTDHTHENTTTGFLLPFSGVFPRVSAGNPRNWGPKSLSWVYHSVWDDIISSSSPLYMYLILILYTL